MAAVAALGLAAGTGCLESGGNSTASAPAPPSAATAAPTSTTAPSGDKSGDKNEPEDYSHLLLDASDLSDSDDTFVVRSTNPGPRGLPGASALFVNTEDTRAVSTTIAIYPDAATATATLRELVSKIDTVVAGASPRPVPVGTDGTLAVGTSPDGSQAATLLVFTHGPALVRLDFQSALGDTTSDPFVLNVAKMQLVAVRTGLDSSC